MFTCLAELVDLNVQAWALYSPSHPTQVQESLLAHHSCYIIWCPLSSQHHSGHPVLLGKPCRDITLRPRISVELKETGQEMDKESRREQ